MRLSLILERNIGMLEGNLFLSSAKRLLLGRMNMLIYRVKDEIGDDQEEQDDVLVLLFRFLT